MLTVTAHTREQGGRGRGQQGGRCKDSRDPEGGEEGPGTGHQGLALGRVRRAPGACFIKGVEKGVRNRRDGNLPLQDQTYSVTLFLKTPERQKLPSLSDDNFKASRGKPCHGTCNHSTDGLEVGILVSFHCYTRFLRLSGPHCKKWTSVASISRVSLPSSDSTSIPSICSWIVSRMTAKVSSLSASKA